jgi:hypothetical protein
MGFWKNIFGADPPPTTFDPGEPTQRDRTQAECHRDRFARALLQAKAAAARGEKTPERVAELQREHDYWDGLARLEAARAAPAIEGEAA